MKSKGSLPTAGSAGDAGKPQGKDSFLRGIFKRFARSDKKEDGGAAVVPANGAAKRQYSREIVDECVGRIRRQNAQIDFLKRVMQSSSDAIIVAEPDGKITMFNKGAEAMFEIDEDMAKVDNLFRICTDSSPDGERISRMLIADQKISGLRVVISGVGGKKTPALLTIDFVPDPENAEPAAIVAILKDNSALEEAHTQLQEAYVKVERLSLTDGMTGLFNRRYFDQKISDEHERMKRGHMAAVSMLFIDIDHFKRFNDTYGHQVGDEVLRVVAEAVKDAIRKIDIPCRYGGEEMAVILPSTEETGAWVLAERIRNRVAGLKVPVGGKTSATITCSIGVRTHREENGDVGAFIHEADQALYRAKQSGRNKTVAFHPAI